MSTITVELPDELASRLEAYAGQLPQILELGLREINAGGLREFSGAAKILEFLANLPLPGDILELRPSPAREHRLEELLEKNRAAGLSPAEQLDISLHVMLNRKCSFPRIGFGVITPLFGVPHPSWIKGLSPISVFELRPYESRLGIKQVAIIL